MISPNDTSCSIKLLGGVLRAPSLQARTRRRRNALQAAGWALALALLAGCPETETADDPNPAVRLFQVRLFYPTALHPFVVSVADLNGDAVLDLVTANRDDNSVSVLLGKASGGGYALHVDYAVGEQPSALAVADVTGDTILDLVVANQTTNDVSVLAGLGDGTFGVETRVALSVNSQPLALAAVDVNADGVPDLVSADNGLGSVSVLLGVGAGAFAAPVRYLVGDRPRSVAAADLNNDAHQDLVTANRDTNNVSVLFGHGDGTFEPAQNLAVGTTPRMVAAVDLNGDLWLDLVTANPGSSDLSVRLGLGGGVFANETRIPIRNGLPTRFTAGDFNRDGDPDLAVLLFSAGEDGAPLGLAAILLGNGAGGFTGPRIFATGVSCFDILAVDINGDLRSDLISADTDASTVTVVFGRGDGGFLAEERFPVGDRPRVVVAVDLNRDNRPDLVTANQDSCDLSVLLGRGDGTFEPESRIPMSDLPRAMAVGFLNNDANLDLVVTNFTQSRVSVFLGLGNGAFQAERLYSVRAAGVPYSSEPRSVVLADPNNDSYIDIITGNANTDSVAFLAGLGNGTFAAPVETDVGNFPLDLHVVDLNGDQALDLVFVSTNDPDNGADAAQPRLVRRLGVGDGTFDEASNERYETGAGPVALDVGDLDGDGDQDAVTAHSGDDSIYLLAGRPEGKFTRGERIRTGDVPNTVVLADVNRDQRLDIVTTNSTETATVLLNRGGLLFQSAINYPLGSDPIGGIVADVNRDGRADLVAVNRATADVCVAMGMP